MARKITPTHVLLNQIELSSSASSVTFSNIPQGYGDLVLRFSGTGAGGTTTPLVRFNSDSGSNYTLVRMYGNGSGTGSTSVTVTAIPYFYSGSAVLGTTQQSGELTIFDYFSVDKHKSALFSGANNSDGIVERLALRWANTAAITNISITTGSGSIAANSIFSLYGVYA